jgi:hypothetical protein
MIAYLTKTRHAHYWVYELRICERPCSGYEYTTAPRIQVKGKREANAYCKANGIKPWNF